MRLSCRPPPKRFTAAYHCHSIEIWGLHDVDDESADNGMLLLEAVYDATANAVQVWGAWMACA